MATEHEMTLNLVDQYKSLLKDIKIFGNDFPDSTKEYNFWIDVAADILNTASIIGLTSLPPLPPKK
ncbi:MAG: hypothetical protein LBM59_06230 [Ruminococcus sp.]|jgi:hypothetical protein|nr:hypothetical protein [Ruminococcus sp.]